jgi:signal transduction histidine kinase
VEGTVVLAVLVALAELTPQRDVPYIVFPVLLWAAVRSGRAEPPRPSSSVCSITVWNTAQNDGPFVRDSVTDSLLATQLFIAVSALTSLVLAAETAERTRAGAALAASEASQRALADEQAALRRVATLVASGVPPSRVFGQVTEEVARLLAMPGANVMRYDGARTATVVGGWSEDGALTLPMGSTFDLDGDTVVAKVLRSGTPQRVDRYEHTSGNLAETMQRSGYRAAVAAPVAVAGRLWGALAAGTRSDEPLPEGLEQRLCDFAELVAQSLANADAHEQLAASRARIVEAGDAERRRLERNLHDGAQQRLVALAVDLTLIGATLERDPPAARKTLTVAQDELQKGIDELRELARGIHPAVLTARGLGPALQALVKRAPVPVEITELPEQRLASPVEAAAYYVVAEAITNVSKYARASHVTVSVRRSGECATVTVSDDGVGGADAARGTGLRGLADRIEPSRPVLWIVHPARHPHQRRDPSPESPAPALGAHPNPPPALPVGCLRSFTVRMDKRVQCRHRHSSRHVTTTSTPMPSSTRPPAWVSRPRSPSSLSPRSPRRRRPTGAPGLVVRRIPDFNAEKNLSPVNNPSDVWRFHAFFTTTPTPRS